jgi:hypothetical protein
MIEDEISNAIGSSMRFYNLFTSDDCWIAIVGDDTGLYRGTGDSPEEALNEAVTDGRFIGTLFGNSVATGIREPTPEQSKLKGRSLLAAIGLLKPKAPINRRI